LVEPKSHHKDKIIGRHGQNLVSRLDFEFDSISGEGFPGRNSGCIDAVKTMHLWFNKTTIGLFNLENGVRDGAKSINLSMRLLSP
jgi:hypothetical protein